MRFTQAAGGVVLNSAGEVAVVSQHGTSWSMPKGHVDAGEDLMTTARREIHEETGIAEIEFVVPLGSYQRTRLKEDGTVDADETREIHLFLFRARKEPLQPLDPDNPEARWVAPEEVLRLLTHPKDRGFFEQVVMAALARHGGAGPIHDPGPVEARPLAHPEDGFHLWVFRPGVPPLVYLRVRGDAGPGLLDVTVRGYDRPGERPEGEVREARKSLGMTVRFEDLIPLDGLAESCDVFLCPTSWGLDDFRLRIVAAQGLLAAPVPQLLNLWSSAGYWYEAEGLALADGRLRRQSRWISRDSFVPFPGAYLRTVAQQIERHLEAPRR